MTCIVPGCGATATQLVEVAFNELHGRELEPASEQLWVCSRHEDAIAQEILSTLDA